jgi:hypothetical protein
MLTKVGGEVTDKTLVKPFNCIQTWTKPQIEKKIKMFVCMQYVNNNIFDASERILLF